MLIFYVTPGYKRLFLLGVVLLLTVYIFRGFIYHTFIQDRVESDVYFWDINMGNLTQDKVEEIVASRIGEWQVNPIDAAYNEEQHVVVPEMWGYRANVEKTVKKIFKASTGENVLPFLEIVLPEVAMDDFPSATISMGNPAKESVAFMINVAWGTEYILPLLDVLSEHDANATFFVVGRWAQENESLIKEMVNQGHLVENHGHTDAAVITEINTEELKKGLQEVNLFIENITKKPVRYFTPHKGEYNRHTLEVISRLGLRTLLWSVDTVDWMEPGVEAMKSRVLDEVHNGAIILMHPTKDTVTAVQEILPQLEKKGLSVDTVEDLLNPEQPPDIAYGE